MALIGHVESTAINGADAPVFERFTGAIAKQEKAQDAVQAQLAAQAKQIADLTGLLGQFLAANTPAPVAEPVAELTPAEKAAATKAANKAKAEAEAKAGE